MPDGTILAERLLKEADQTIADLRKELRLKDGQLANCHKEIFKLREQLIAYAGLAPEGPKSPTN